MVHVPRTKHDTIPLKIKVIKLELDSYTADILLVKVQLQGLGGHITDKPGCRDSSHILGSVVETEEVDYWDKLEDKMPELCRKHVLIAPLRACRVVWRGDGGDIAGGGALGPTRPSKNGSFCSPRTTLRVLREHHVRYILPKKCG
jgi:hypothetical protein